MVTTCYLQMCSKFSTYYKLSKIRPTNNTITAYIDERNYDIFLNTTFIYLCYIFFTQLITHIYNVKCNELQKSYLKLYWIFVLFVCAHSLQEGCKNGDKMEIEKYDIYLDATSILLFYLFILYLN